MNSIAYIRHSIKERVPEQFYDETRIFHLHGAIDYSHLNLKHRMMMAVIHSKISKMPEEKLNAEAKTILATYGKKEDFVDYSSLTAVMLPSASETTVLHPDPNCDTTVSGASNS